MQMPGTDSTVDEPAHGSLGPAASSHPGGEAGKTIALADYPTRLTAVVDGNRLALGLVAAYLSETPGTDPEAYLARLTEAAASAPHSADYPHGLYAAFWLSLEQVEAEEGVSGAMLAYFAAAPISSVPPELFQYPASVYPPELAAAVTDPEHKSRVLALLDRYALINQEPVSGWLSLGDGLRAPLKDLLGAQFDTWNQSATGVIEALGLLSSPALEELQTLHTSITAEYAPPSETQDQIADEQPIDRVPESLEADPAKLLEAEPEAAVQIVGRRERLDAEMQETDSFALTVDPMPALAPKPNLVARLFGRR